jgi:hypothetical protein
MPTTAQLASFEPNGRKLISSWSILMSGSQKVSTLITCWKFPTPMLLVSDDPLCQNEQEAATQFHNTAVR